MVLGSAEVAVHVGILLFVHKGPVFCGFSVYFKISNYLDMLATL